MLAIAVCLLFHFLLFSGIFGFVERLFPSDDVFFVVGVLLETLAVFAILYRTPLISQTPGRAAGVGRVVGLVVLAHVFVFFGLMTGIVGLCLAFAAFRSWVGSTKKKE